MMTGSTVTCDEAQVFQRDPVPTWYLSTLRRIALNLPKAETAKPKEPIRGKRIFAALDPAFLGSIIGLRQM